MKQLRLVAKPAGNGRLLSLVDCAAETCSTVLLTTDKSKEDIYPGLIVHVMKEDIEKELASINSKCILELDLSSSSLAVYELSLHNYKNLEGITFQTEPHGFNMYVTMDFDDTDNPPLNITITRHSSIVIELGDKSYAFAID